MKKLNPTQIIEDKQITKKIMFDYLTDHTIKDFCTKFELTNTQFKCIANYFGGYKTPPNKRKAINQKNGKQSLNVKKQIKQTYYQNHKSVWMEDLKNKITKEEFIAYYLDHTKEETRQYFNISKKMIQKLITLYECTYISNDHMKNSLRWAKNKVTGETHRKACQEKYGVDNVGQLPEVKAKIRNTVLKHKEENINYYKEISTKSKRSILEHYGTYENYLEARNEKTKNTLTENYGNLANAYALNHQKGSQTKQKKYGDANYNNREKAKATTFKKYGKDYYTQTTKYIEKTIDTNRKKYGVDFTCQLSQCRISGSSNSGPNKEFEILLNQANLEYEREFNLEHRSFDFKLENTLIEINPTSTHNATYTPFKRKELLDKKYHFNKTKLAHDNNFKCINIWDWDDKQKIVNSLQSKELIYARKCIVKEISIEEASQFINKYHFQNYCKDTIRLGLYFNSNLVSVMTFGAPRYNKNYEYELLRYCSNSKVVGGPEKLFKFFIKAYKPKSIVSYCDLSKFTGSMYTNLGFNQKRVSIGKHWFNPKTKQHITDNLLRQRGFDQLFDTSYGKNTSNEELMKQSGFVEIYDCGQVTYIWEKK